MRMSYLECTVRKTLSTVKRVALFSSSSEMKIWKNHNFAFFGKYLNFVTFNYLIRFSKVLPLGFSLVSVEFIINILPCYHNSPLKIHKAAKTSSFPLTELATSSFASAVAFHLLPDSVKVLLPRSTLGTIN